MAELTCDVPAAPDLGGRHSLGRMAAAHCTHCGGEDLEPGFVEDMGQASQGYLRWIQGPLERGLFGGARRLGRSRWVVDAHRCRTCGHLELFAKNPT